jgi:hypothetical protein
LNQFAMPAQHSLRLYQKCSPGRPRQPVPQGGQDHPIIRLLSDALDLPFENVNLSAQRQHLGPQLGLVAVARCDRVEYDADERLGIAAITTAADRNRSFLFAAQRPVVSSTSNSADFVYPTTGLSVRELLISSLLPSDD